MEDEVWRDTRDGAVWSPWGIAALVGTNWLDETPRAFEYAPGLWHEADGVVHGTLEGETITLHPGEEAIRGDVLLRAFSRDGAVALRVLSPDGARERGISSIERFPYDPSAVVRGGASEASAARVDTVSVDGHHASADYETTVTFEWEHTPLTLAAHRQEDGSLFAIFSDATSGSESHRFRQLRMPRPAADGTVEVNLNHATLPPCAFSDHYVCILPPAGNRLPVPVRAGEALVH